MVAEREKGRLMVEREKGRVVAEGVEGMGRVSGIGVLRLRGSQGREPLRSG